MTTATRRFALWRADLAGGVCAAPDECVDDLRHLDRVPVTLEHDVYGVTPMSEVFETSLRDGQFTGIEWPGDLRPGVQVTVEWHARSGAIVARTIPLEEPVRVDGVDYFHEYDPKVVTREFEPGPANWSKVLHAVCRHGRVFDDGSAVFAEAKIAVKAGLGRGAKGAFLLKNAIDQLLREGYVTRVQGSGDSTFPAEDGAEPVGMLFYAPLVDPTAPPEGRHDHWVNGFIRKLPAGAQPSEKQLSLHQRAVASEQIDPVPLEPGYTFVQKHHRHG
ncbi:hypothetical protein GCM10010172_84020 [Paractinoplanes ferrugineus]|uniref:Uncharacterized protein n=1 Tax=Paractinoplanes ferrugineus TaxID=113564 RepID=A0A919IYZ4_9ACTN|nr:hypothetical protein [Actinoplanes ferrugineus]GIE10724.1 hypothetical protein Afe05nite_25640 [Actinoplanes ferrugineus]